MPADLRFLQGPQGAELIRQAQAGEGIFASPAPTPLQLPSEVQVGFERRRSALDTAFSEAMARLGAQEEQLNLDEQIGATQLQRQQSRARQRLPGAFAGRGLLNSGVFRGGTTGALGQFAQSSTDQFVNFRRGFLRRRTDLTNRLRDLDANRAIQFADIALDEQTRRSAIASVVNANT
jgi:hypothetical protein